MVLVTEGLLVGFAVVSVVVATLRAGSRALYLSEHDAIGVMDGPTIKGPYDVNETSQMSPVWDISFPFQHAVHLALFPQFYSFEEHEESQASGDGAMTGRDDLTEEDAPKNNTQPSIVGPFSKLQPVQKLVTNQWKLWGTLVQPKAIDEYYLHDHSLVDEPLDWDYTLKKSSSIQFNGTAGVTLTAEIAATAPYTFADLRSRFGISEQDFFQSMLASGPFVSFQSNSKGAARAGGVFFFTRDGAYMIKTIKKAEAKELLKMLPKYHAHMKQNGRRSLLTRFCGMYTVTLRQPHEGFVKGKAEEEHVFIVMNSVFPAEASQFITERYDLKGSTVGREASEEEKIKKGRNAVLKDLDLLREVELVKSHTPSNRGSSNEYGLSLGPTQKAELLSQLRRDVKLLVDCQVMDYSLLVGVANMDMGRYDLSSLQAIDKSEAQQSLMQQVSERRGGKDNRQALIRSAILYPLQILGAPAVHAGRRVLSLADSTLSSILTQPLPYYGAGICGVDGGELSKLNGKRNGKKALYFLGLIDFLQPWTRRKVMERQLKGLLGYDTNAISCVTPEEYAKRFLAYLEATLC